MLKGNGINAHSLCQRYSCTQFFQGDCCTQFMPGDLQFMTGVGVQRSLGDAEAWNSWV